MAEPAVAVREQLLATLVWPSGAGGVLLLGGVVAGGAQACTSTGDGVSGSVSCTGETGVLGWPLTLLWVVPPVVVAIALCRIAAARAWGGLEVAGVVLLALGGVLVPVLGAVAALWFGVTLSRSARRLAS